MLHDRGGCKNVSASVFHATFDGDLQTKWAITFRGAPPSVERSSARFLILQPFSVAMLERPPSHQQYFDGANHQENPKNLDKPNRQQIEV